MVLTKREKELLAEYKRIARGSPIKVTQYKKNESMVRFRGNGNNAIRQIGSNVASVSPKEQLKAMVKVAKIKNIKVKRRKKK